MNLFSNTLSKAIAFIYVLFRRLRKKSKKICNRQVLMYVDGNMGNVIMDAPAIGDLIQHYINCGKRVFILCDSVLWKTLSLLINISCVTYLECNTYSSGHGTDFPTVKRTLDLLNRYSFEIFIVTLPTVMPLAHYMAATLQANESWGVFDDIQHSKGYFRYFFERYYTNRLFASVNMQEAQRLKLLLTKLGVADHKTRIQYIPPLIESGEHDPYITVAVDSMATARRWECSKFIELIRMLLDAYPFDVYLTGSNVSRSEYLQYADSFKNTPRVKNYIGKTGFEEWVEMLRHSRLHIGVDSGSIHVAASVGTQAICLSGVWDAKRCMPYQIDEADERTVEPICVYRSDVDVDSLECYACKIRSGRIGNGNHECHQACKEGSTCLCLQKINVNDVFGAICKYLTEDSVETK